MTNFFDSEDIVCFIFARGGSKGLPDKNIRPLLGKPLIQWAIETAFEVSEISRVIVSTDSEQIADIAIACGAEVPFLRPDYLSSDTSAELDAWKHALIYLRDEEFSKPAVMVSLPVTAPLRLPEDVINAIQLFLKTDSDLVVAVSEAQRSPYFNMLIKENDLFRLANSSLNITRRQDAPDFYDLSTVVYVASTDFVLSCNRILDGKTRAILIPRSHAVDIDDAFDFEFAEFLMARRNAMIIDSLPE
jgi:CMP-N-acetylneuraminic acid synthetase